MRIAGLVIAVVDPAGYVMGNGSQRGLAFHHTMSIEYLVMHAQTCDGSCQIRDGLQ
jgi:hypothetical protein